MGESSLTKEQIAEKTRQGMNCCQCVLGEYRRLLAVIRHTVPYRVFIWRRNARGDTCGAVAGALMVVGLAYASDKPLLRKSIPVSGAFSFSLRQHVCRELLDCDFSAGTARTRTFLGHHRPLLSRVYRNSPLHSG